MIATKKQLLLDGETPYSIRNKISKGVLFLVERGLFSDKANPYFDEAYICAKYPNAIITGLSAFYYYDLTDQIPQDIYVATAQHSYPIRRKGVIQSYQEPSFFSIGRTMIKVESGYINIYDIERTFIELIRLREKYPAELYYEVMGSFRKIKDKIDFYKVQQYLKAFPREGAYILQKIKEVI